MSLSCFSACWPSRAQRVQPFDTADPIKKKKDPRQLAKESIPQDAQADLNAPGFKDASLFIKNPPLQEGSHKAFPQAPLTAWGGDALFGIFGP
jgi:hypothetical protein